MKTIFDQLMMGDEHYKIVRHGIYEIHTTGVHTRVFSAVTMSLQGKAHVLSDGRWSWTDGGRLSDDIKRVAERAAASLEGK